MLSWQRLSFRIFSSSRIIVCTVPTLTSNCALIVSITTRRSLSIKFFIWPISSGVLTSLLLPHLSSSITDSLPSLNLLCHSKTDARFMQDALKAVWSINTFLWHFFQLFPSLKQNFIAYRCSKVSSRPDCIFEIHQLWQSSFSRVYSNSCCSCSFEPEIIKIGQSSHKILNFQESTTILNACTEKSGNLMKAPRISFIVNFCLGKFSFSLDTFWTYLVYKMSLWCNENNSIKSFIAILIINQLNLLQNSFLGKPYTDEDVSTSEKSVVILQLKLIHHNLLPVQKFWKLQPHSSLLNRL